MLSLLFSFLGWTVIPDVVTKLILRFTTTPQKEYTKRYRITFAFVVLSYLSYTLFSSSSLSSAPNYYQQLGVPVSVDDHALKNAYKSWVRRNHPDKLGGTSHAEHTFRRIQEGFQVLKDPTLRAAYNRFGPDVLTWSTCTTLRDYLRQGLLQSSGFHIATSIGLIGVSSLGRPSPVAFWRYLLYIAFLATELSLLLSPTPSTSFSLLSFLFPRRVPYQHVRFLHELFMFLSIALSKIAPVLFPGQQLDVADAQAVEGLDNILERIRTLIGGLDADVNQMLTAELISLTSMPHSLSSAHISAPTHPVPPPFTALPPLCPRTLPDAAVLRRLENEIEEMIVEGSVREEAGGWRDGGNSSGEEERSPGGSARARAVSAPVRDLFARLERGQRVTWAGGQHDGDTHVVGKGRRAHPAWEQRALSCSPSAFAKASAMAVVPRYSPPPSPSPASRAQQPSSPSPLMLGEVAQRPGYVRARSVSC